MISYLKHLVESFRSAFWPLPALIVFLSFLCAELLVHFDSSLRFSNRGWFPEITASGVRSFLTAAASGTITLAALVFSTTLVALTLASSQFGPRLLHNFIRARTNQGMLGLLTGAFLFCLVVLRSTREHEVPHLAVYVAFTLTISSVTLFLYFVHHLVRSLQAENIVAMVADQLINRIEAFFPEVSSSQDEDEAERERKSWDELKDEVSVSSTADGYLQFVDTSTLLELAIEEDCRIRAMVRPGQLLLNGECLFAYEKPEGLSDEAVRRFSECFIIGRKRTPDQDFEFEIRQLVEVGVRALSPGINDPFTAANCIDFLAIALGRIARRSLPRNMFFDDDSNLRLRLRPTSFRNLLETSFLQLRHDGSGRPDVSLRLFEALLLIGRQTRNEEQLCAVCDFAELLNQESTEKCSSEFDRKCFQEVFQSILELREERRKASCPPSGK